jgi:hypothetical protein
MLKKPLTRRRAVLSVTLFHLFCLAVFLELARRAPVIEERR